MRRASIFIRALFFASSLLLSGNFVYAVNPDEVLQDAKLEHRARELSKEIRCMVCQNQSIDDSDATVAKDLRILIRERLTAGDSDKQVLDFLVARFGEFVLLKPRFSISNAILWLTPILFLAFGILAAFIFTLRNRKIDTNEVNIDHSLDKAEQKELTKILGERD